MVARRPRSPYTRRPRPGSRGEVLAWLPDGRPADVYSSMCPSRKALDRIADKWTALVVGALNTGPRRFGQLRADLEGISHKMLTQTLRSMERDGLVTRRVQSTVPLHVEYELTDLGLSLEEPLSAVRDWAERHINDLEKARATYDETASTSAQ